MKEVTSEAGGRAPPGANRRLPAQDLVGLPQFPDLTLQRLHALGHLGRHASTLAGVDLGLLTHSFSVCAVQPILDAIEVIAAQRDGCSSRDPEADGSHARELQEKTCCCIAHDGSPSQELEPPANLGWFTDRLRRDGEIGVCFWSAKIR